MNSKTIFQSAMGLGLAVILLAGCSDKKSDATSEKTATAAPGVAAITPEEQDLLPPELASLARVSA